MPFQVRAAARTRARAPRHRDAGCVVTFPAGAVIFRSPFLEGDRLPMVQRTRGGNTRAWARRAAALFCATWGVAALAQEREPQPAQAQHPPLYLAAPPPPETVYTPPAPPREDQ